MQVQIQKQQGDVNIITIDEFPFPGGLSEWPQTEIKTGIVREGTATGHSHRIVGTEFRLFTQGRGMFANIISRDCKMVHEEHESIDLEPGKYEFVQTTEYDHFEEKSRRVVD